MKISTAQLEQNVLSALIVAVILAASAWAYHHFVATAAGEK